MRLAVISDIHGNYKALEAFIAYINELRKDGKGVDEILCLGDYFTDGPDPVRVLHTLRELEKEYPCHYVLGNREEYLLDNRREPQGWKISSPNGLLYFVDQKLTEEVLDFMRELPLTQRLSFEGAKDILICHSAPTNTRANFMEDPGLHAHCMKHLEASYLVAGHTHRQEATKLYGKTYINPGALGSAIDGVGRQAPFAIMESTPSGEWQAELINIPYDIDTFLKDFEESGLMDAGLVLGRAVRRTLLTGVNYFFKIIMVARRMSGLPIPEIPEEIWEKAEKEFED